MPTAPSSTGGNQSVPTPTGLLSLPIKPGPGSVRQEGVDKPHQASYEVLDQRQGPHSVRSVHPGTWNEGAARGSREGRNPHGPCPGPETESVLSKKRRLKKCKPLGCRGSDTPIPAAKDTDPLRAGCPRPRPNTRGCAHFGQKPGRPVRKPAHRATGNTQPLGGLSGPGEASTSENGVSSSGRGPA